MNDPLVSIIIPTYNNQYTLAVCLESINNQTYSQIETIIVDGGSNDLTIQIAGSYGAEVIESDLGMAAARKRGAEIANGEFLFHVDSDMELTPDVVKSCVENMQEHDALIIPETNVGGTFWAKATDIGKRISRRKKAGNLRFLKIEDYIDVGGHNPELLGKEDRELHILILEHVDSVGHIDDKIRHHVGNLTLFDLLSRRWKYMKSLVDYEDVSRIRKEQERSYGSTNMSKSTSTILVREFLKDPDLVLGYILLQVLTIGLSGYRKLREI